MEGGFEKQSKRKGLQEARTWTLLGTGKVQSHPNTNSILQPSQTAVLLLVLLLMPLLWASEIIERVQVYVRSTGTSTGTFTGTSTGTVQ